MKPPKRGQELGICPICSEVVLGRFSDHIRGHLPQGEHPDHWMSEQDRQEHQEISEKRKKRLNV